MGFDARDWPRARLQRGLPSWLGVDMPIGASDGRAIGRAVQAVAGTDVRQLARQVGAVIRVVRLDADTGGLAALLLPMLTGGFTIEVDPRPSPDDVGIGRTGVIRSRVAHELGHVLFYAPGTPPTRSDRPTTREERFCDEFAAGLLVPPRLRRRSVAATVRAADVTPEIAILALAA